LSGGHLTFGLRPPIGGYILRITREEWFHQVFELKKYYPGVRRTWTPGLMVILAKKMEAGDSFVGYGTIGGFVELENLPEGERKMCESMGWKGAIIFDSLFKFDPPLPIKETVLHDSKAKGRYLHGFPLTNDQLDSILSKAEVLCNIYKV